MRRASRIAQTALVVAFLATAVSGCEQGGPASTSPASTAATKAAGSLRARADELSQRGQYEEALAAYREALRQEPNDLALRYAVAVTLASLNRRAEATEAYRVTARTTANARRPAAVGTAASGRKAPAPVATPLPPRNRSQTGYM